MSKILLGKIALIVYPVTVMMTIISLILSDYVQAGICCIVSGIFYRYLSNEFIDTVEDENE